ncbi:MAG: alpha-L-fucosidase [candidate division KSB1 bacterium]|nr:alpha-L-fucosidase [candidate division KSB1 bacterium]
MVKAVGAIGDASMRKIDMQPTTLFLFMIWLSAVSSGSMSMAQKRISPPAPHGPIPSERQLRWHEMEFYGFLHFSMNTFTDKEWGYGDESPVLFNPTDFDASEIARLAKAVGMKGLILTAKHHDGFCLWPSQYTEHSVKNSPWKNGKGDVVKEMAEACRRHGLKFGVYLSPWDRNHKDYGTLEYIKYYRNQLRELLTNYGEIFEVWHDGANGGDGYYGGARESRRINPKTYYDWPETWALVRQLQPHAVIFSDVGPDIRWVGNENGYAGETCWAMYSPVGADGGEPAPGDTRYQEGFEGHREGKFWLPAECDVSIRPGWFYHAHEDSLVKTPAQLFDLYFQSVGRNASLLLNVPPDRYGRWHENDVKALRAFKRLLDLTFSRDLAASATVTASNVRGNDPRFAAKNVVDGKKETYWATDDSVTAASLVFTLRQKSTFNCLMLQEYIALGQRIEAFAVEQWNGNAWTPVTAGTTIGHKRLLRFPSVTANKIRLLIRQAKACPTISNFGLFQTPEILPDSR